MGVSLGDLGGHRRKVRSLSLTRLVQRCGRLMQKLSYVQVKVQRRPILLQK
jgi:hypothetical protein